MVRIDEAFQQGISGEPMVVTAETGTLTNISGFISSLSGSVVNAFNAFTSSEQQSAAQTAAAQARAAAATAPKSQFGALVPLIIAGVAVGIIVRLVTKR